VVAAMLNFTGSTNAYQEWCSLLNLVEISDCSWDTRLFVYGSCHLGAYR